MPLHDDGDGEGDDPLAVPHRVLGQPRRPPPHSEGLIVQVEGEPVLRGSPRTILSLIIHALSTGLGIETLGFLRTFFVYLLRYIWPVS